MKTRLLHNTRIVSSSSSQLSSASGQSTLVEDKVFVRTANTHTRQGSDIGPIWVMKSWSLVLGKEMRRYSPIETGSQFIFQCSLPFVCRFTGKQGSRNRRMRQCNTIKLPFKLSKICINQSYGKLEAVWTTPAGSQRSVNSVEPTVEETSDDKHYFGG